MFRSYYHNNIMHGFIKEPSPTRTRSATEVLHSVKLVNVNTARTQSWAWAVYWKQSWCYRTNCAVMLFQAATFAVFIHTGCVPKCIALQCGAVRRTVLQLNAPHSMW